MRLLSVLAALVFSAPLVFAADQVAHPFIWWTKEDAAAIKAKIDAGGDVQIQLQRTKEACHKGPQLRDQAKPLWDLFQWLVNKDEAARDRQLKALRAFIGRQPQTDAGGTWVVGNSSTTDAHMRDEQSMNALRYDMLNDLLSDAERQGIEDTFRVYIEFQLSGHRPIHPHFGYGRTDTLPNMHWPRAIGTHLMAVAMQDEELIDKLWNGYGGWYWFFDQYLADGFYMEEFAKYYSNIGTMMLICEGLERLGLGDKYGYGYVSKSGATVRDFLFMPTRLAYPKTSLPGGIDHIAVVQMGDTPSKSPLHGIFGHAFVPGYLRPESTLKGGPKGNSYFTAPHMNGPFPKMQAPLWCEVGQRRWPDAGFDYFIAQMRRPGEAKAYPTLFFGLDPVDPKAVTPPAPESIVSRQRGFAFLKADETESYYESGNPAAALQFGMYYVHYAHDCFSLLGYHAFGRPLYARAWGSRDAHVKNHSIASGGKGYIGGHAWFDTPRGHAGVTVDNLKPRPVDHGQAGCLNQRIRDQLGQDMKFVAVAADGLYPNVWQERALFLTKEYMVDVFANRSATKRRYEWGLSGAGTLAMDGWKPTTELNGSMLYRDLGEAQPEGYENKRDGNDPREVHMFAAGDQVWSTHIVQDYTGSDVTTSALGPAWYDRQVGVRISMAGGAGTTVFGGRPPLGSNGPLDKQPAYGETGGAWLNVRRETANTNFVALHQPFENGQVPTSTMTTLVDNDDLVAVAVSGVGGVAGTAFNDRAMVATGRDVDGARTVAHEQERYVFQRQLWLRIGAEAVTVIGYPSELVVPVTGTPSLTINGAAVEAAVSDGVLRWKGSIEPAAFPAVDKPSFANEIDKLIHQLGDPNTGTREHASIVLARMGAEAERAIPALLKGLTEKKTVGNKIAAEVLSWMGPVALPHLGELLSHADPYVRGEVLFGLQSYADDLSSIMPKVMVCLQDENRYVRRNALKLVIKQGASAKDALPVLVKLLDDHVNRRYAIFALSAIGSDAIETCVGLLGHEHHASAALAALAGMGAEAESALAQVTPFLNGPLATQALAVLSAVGKPAASQLDTVLPLLQGGDPALIGAAAKAIASWAPLADGAADPVPALVAAAKNAEGVYRSAVIRALGRFPGEATTGLLKEALANKAPLDDKKAGLRLLAEMALDAAGDDPVIRENLTVLFDYDKRRKRYRQAAALVVVLAHPKFPVLTYEEQLVSMLADKNAGLRATAAAALLSRQPDHAKAAEALLAGLVAVNLRKKRSQDAERNAAWKQLPLACQGGFAIAWDTYLNHEDADIRRRALSALAYFPKAFADKADHMVTLLASDDNKTVIAAATALIKAGAPQAEDALRAYMDRAAALSWREKSALVGNLATLGAQHKELVIPRLKAFAQDTDFFVRKAAEGALYRLAQ